MLRLGGVSGPGVVHGLVVSETPEPVGWLRLGGFRNEQGCGQEPYSRGLGGKPDMGSDRGINAAFRSIELMLR